VSDHYANSVRMNPVLFVDFGVLLHRLVSSLSGRLRTRRPQ
jgi:hypothetical protein